MPPTPGAAADASILEAFANQYAGRRYRIVHRCPEFTSVCPKTGQPDFGVLTFGYIPGDLCVELKSLKLYLQQYRTLGIFYEHVTNQILDHFVACCQPQFARVVSDWGARGGISSRIVATHRAPKH